MSDFTQRLNLTNMIEEQIVDLFSSSVVREFGCRQIIGDSEELSDFMKTPEINQMASGMMIKFAPDFIILNQGRIFFLDVKHSVSPVWSPKRIDMLRNKISDTTLSVSDVGVIAREALLSYNRFYPNTIILMASPYNPKILMAQFSRKIRCLYCYRSKSPDYDCSNCPSKTGGFFDIERAIKSDGSQTPMTDVDFRSFEPAELFFNNIGIEIDSKVIGRIKEEIKNEPITFSEKTYPELKERVLLELIYEGCDWIEHPVYSKAKNDFYHLDPDCYFIRNTPSELLTYKSISDAKDDGKRACLRCAQYNA